MKVWSYTIKGRKPVNEDYLFHQDLGNNRYICLIADGMGGYPKGDVAAKMVADSILALVSSHKHIDQKLLQIAINKANLALRQCIKKTGEIFGATLGGVYIEHEVAICFWVGDVKIYHYQDNSLIFESTPHTLINQLKFRGLIEAKRNLDWYKNIVTQSIHGDSTNPKADFYITSIKNYDTFFLHSDGFSFDISSTKPDKEWLNKISKEISVRNDKHDDTSFVLLNI